ncbi:uncharacterized protein DUF2059 [Roseimicrobium gellanilyticum]|uniref:Uncharacterized protein DUF2059 n=1 Tax=Roseimicrobium gellanilyticum TaxID=748857 RepID=A0A366HVE3_9BACT|nr:DUF2059 domain-containing protein [Roseimicrobium gellanilyticum]RBP48232.1 uncharacterized protein DUF2059 [Roseimicrobium gellanilyticum]
MKTKLLLLCCCALALPAFALDDTPENRAKEADRYFEAAAPKEMLDEMTTQMAAAVPDAEKAKFKELLTKHFNYESFVKSMKDAMVRHFTATELAALADFYSSDVGKSAMKKMGAYTAEIMPLVQTEILKAQQKAMNDQGGLAAMPPGAAAPQTPSTTVPVAPGAPASTIPSPPGQPTAGQPAQPGFGQPAQGQPQPQPQPQPFPAAPGPVGGIPSSPPEVISATKG